VMTSLTLLSSCLLLQTVTSYAKVLRLLLSRFIKATLSLSQRFKPTLV
jgi:hypothetical protein